MVREFEGKTEQEAIAIAMAELQLEQDELDIEIIESEKRGLFKKGNVRIRVYLPNEEEQGSQEFEEFEESVIEFLSNVLNKMGYPSNVTLSYRTEGKIGLDIVTDHSAIIIGRKGKNLDALQLIVNVFAGQLDPSMKVIIDSENYRIRHEEELVKLAFRTAKQVLREGQSYLLEPMNPYERRLVHTALSDMRGVVTKSEGNGLLKQVRISSDETLAPLGNRK